MMSPVFSTVLALACYVLLTGNTAEAEDSLFEKRLTTQEFEDYILVCTQDPLDLAFVVDASSSIWSRNFTFGKKFIEDFLRMYHIGPDAVRIAVVTFGMGVYRRDSFGFTRYDKKEDVLKAIRNLPYPAGSATYTWRGIDYMVDVLMAKARPGVPHISIVLTDGNSQRPDLTAKSAERARESGVKIFAIGVGYRVSTTELMNIAGSKQNYFQVDNYGALKKIKKNLAFQACEKKERPTTTPPKAEPCGVTDPADIMFVFDPARLGLNGVGKATQIISHVSKAEEMDEGMQLGVASGQCPMDKGFPLDRYQDRESLADRLALYDKDKLPSIVHEACTKGFASDAGGRPDARKVAVLSIGGKLDRDALLKAVAEAKGKGVRLFFSDAGNADSSLMDTLGQHGQVLRGSSREQSEYLLNYLCPKLS